MHKLLSWLASVAAFKGGKVGFGMAIAATKIQSFDVDEHVFPRLEEWAKTANHKVTPVSNFKSDVARYCTNAPRFWPSLRYLPLV